jgi:hypothetical protein
MIDIYITYIDDTFKERIEDLKSLNSLFVHFINENTRKGLKEGYKLRSHWGATLSPFILITKDNVPIKAFYSESKSDLVQDLNNFLKNYDN